jgi:hypothetical protein
MSRENVEIVRRTLAAVAAGQPEQALEFAPATRRFVDDENVVDLSEPMLRR